MTIIYPVPELFPDHRARFLQIVNTCHAMAETGNRVVLIAGLRKGYSIDGALAFYGLERNENFSIVQLPILRREQSRKLRFAWHGVFHFFLLLYLLLYRTYEKDKTVIYLRHIKLADFILKFRRIIDMPVVFEIHEIFHLGAAQKNERLKQLEHKVYGKADALACTSSHLGHFLSEFAGGASSVHIIQHGIKEEWLGLQRNAAPSYICYTGSLYPWKGVDVLVSAVKYSPGEKFLIIGGGDRLSELRSLAESEGVADRITFAGAAPHESIPGYLMQAKIAVLPNVESDESLFSSPLKLFEYMACGVPIVASDLPVFREALKDRENALLFKPGDAESLARCIKELVCNHDLAQRLANAARASAINYTYKKRAEKILDLCNLVYNKFGKKGRI